MEQTNQILRMTRRENGRKMFKDMCLAINAEINAEKAIRRAKTPADWINAKAAVVANYALCAKAIVSVREWDARSNPWAKELTSPERRRQRIESFYVPPAPPNSPIRTKFR